MDSLASDCLRIIKEQSKRKDIVIIILIIVIFLNNLAWVIAWNLPVERVTESYELEGEDDANVFYNGEGEERICITSAAWSSSLTMRV